MMRNAEDALRFFEHKVRNLQCGLRDPMHMVKTTLWAGCLAYRHGSLQSTVDDFVERTNESHFVAILVCFHCWLLQSENDLLMFRSSIGRTDKAAEEAHRGCRRSRRVPCLGNGFVLPAVQANASNIGIVSGVVPESLSCTSS